MLCNCTLHDNIMFGSNLNDIYIYIYIYINTNYILNIIASSALYKINRFNIGDDIIKYIWLEGW